MSGALGADERHAGRKGTRKIFAARRLCRLNGSLRFRLRQGFVGQAGRDDETAGGQGQGIGGWNWGGMEEVIWARVRLL